MSILLVEDEPQVRAKGLREDGYSVDIAENGDEAFYLVRIGWYDLIVPGLIFYSF